MRLLLCFLVFTLLSCSNSPTKDKHSTDTIRLEKAPKNESYIDPLLVDTPKILKPGEDYFTISTSPDDKIYFGDKFSPYKLEPYDIANIEHVIDSLIHSQKTNGAFKNKSLTDFKYQILSAKTTKQKFQVRVLAICNEQADRKKWNSVRLEIEDSKGCYFSLIYDLTDKKTVQSNFNANGKKHGH